jgi:hypothetical protein
MSISGLVTAECPECGQSIVPGAAGCQFCGADFSSNSSRPAVSSGARPEAEPSLWYTISAIFWIVIGLSQAIPTIGFLGTTRGQVELDNRYPAIASMLTALVGASLILICFGIVVAGGMLAKSPCSRKAAVTYSWFGTVILTFAAFFLLYEVVMETDLTAVLALLFTAVMDVMTFVTRWAIVNSGPGYRSTQPKL